MTAEGLTNVLETKRLVLRQWGDRDYPMFAELNADAEVMRYFPSALTNEQSNALADNISGFIDENGWGLWAVELKSTNEFTGFVGLNRPADNLPCAPCVEIGWRLSREYWGHGYATEAAFRALDFAFAELHLDDVVSFTSLGNQSSQKVMRKIGLSDTGNNFDHPSLSSADPLLEHVLFSISKRDWRTR